MHMRKPLLQPLEHVQIVLKWQIRMETANDVKLGGAGVRSFFGAFINLFQRKGVSLRGTNVLAECAQSALQNANVGGFNMTVYVETGMLAMKLFSDEIGQKSDP